MKIETHKVINGKPVVLFKSLGKGLEFYYELDDTQNYYMVRNEIVICKLELSASYGEISFASISEIVEY